MEVFKDKLGPMSFSMRSYTLVRLKVLGVGRLLERPQYQYVCER